MSDVTTCPACKVRLRLPEGAIGVELQCPHCHHLFKETTSTIQAKREGPDGIRRNVSVPKEDTFRHLEEEDYSFPRVRGPLTGFGRAKAAMILIAISLVVHGIGMLISWRFLDELGQGLGANRQQIQSWKTFYDRWIFLEIGCRIIAGILFLMWISDAYENLHALGSIGLRYSSGWAVGYFFIPILNLFRPIQVVQEIWRESDPHATGRNSVLAGFWWAFWLLWGFFDQASFRLMWSGLLEDIRPALTFGVVSGCFCIAAGILVMMLIKAIMTNQIQKYDRLVSQCVYE